MQLDQYISDLLYRYECIIVPEFGAFLTHYKSAQVHETTHAFYPPKKSISFNKQLVQGDGLLVDYVATVQKTDYATAQLAVANAVTQFKKKIAQGETLTLKNVGSFTAEEDRWLFTPSQHLNYLTDSFGLSTFTMNEIARVASHPSEAPAVVLATKAAVEQTIPSRSARPWLKYAAIGLVAVAATSFGGFRYLKSIEAHNLAASTEAQTQVEAQIQEATFAIENPLPTIKLVLSKPSGNYHVVGGAFRDPANAEKRVEQLKAKGYKARIIGKNKYGLHQVAYDSYTNAQDALTALREVRAQDEKSAWLLVKKLAE